MARNAFSVPIFFIVFREMVEGAIVIAILLGLVEHIVREGAGKLSSVTAPTTAESNGGDHVQRLRRRLRLQVRSLNGFTTY
jgi:high-affinity Fe2+/Pb2+ permease